MATGPQIPTDPLELLSYDPTRVEPFVNKFWAPGLCGTLAFLGVCVGNWGTKRPMLSGLQTHVLFTLAGAYIGKYFDGRRSRYFADRDAVLRHYVQLHPEDFPIPERRKFADIIEPWVPIR